MHEAGVFNLLGKLNRYYLSIDFNLPDAGWKANQIIVQTSVPVITFEEAKTILYLYVLGCSSGLLFFAYEIFPFIDIYKVLKATILSFIATKTKTQSLT